MSFKDLLVLIIAAAVMFGGYKYSTNPYRTSLPFGTTDLSSVQKPLQRLPPEDRKRVEEYVQRTNGDYLPAAFGDPDNPMTARTFAEAIEIQKVWEVKMQAQKAREAQLAAEREKRMQPLREQVMVELVQAMILTRNEASARIDPGFYKRPYQVDTSPTTVVRIRLSNVGAQTVMAFTGSLKGIDSQSWLPLDLCWVEYSRQLNPDESLELECVGRFAGVSQQMRDFINAPESTRFRVTWEPHSVTLASGEKLESKVY